LKTGQVKVAKVGEQHIELKFKLSNLNLLFFFLKNYFVTVVDALLAEKILKIQ